MRCGGFCFQCFQLEECAYSMSKCKKNLLALDNLQRFRHALDDSQTSPHLLISNRLKCNAASNQMGVHCD